MSASTNSLPLDLPILDWEDLDEPARAAALLRTEIGSSSELADAVKRIVD